MQRIALDIGGTKIEGILTADSPLDVIHRKRISHDKNADYGDFIDLVVATINNLIQRATEPVAIGIGMPGSISTKTKLLRNSSILSANDRAFQVDLEQRLGRSVYIGNDANCMTLSEACFGAGQGCRTVVGVIIGTGLGGGIVIDKKIMVGKQGYAAEWGHICIELEGKECWCGRRGCQEQYVSGTGFERIYQELANEKAKVPEIYAKWQQGDPIAVAATNQFLNYFSRVIANLIFTLDPDVITIGGGVSRLPLLYDEGVKCIKAQFKEGVAVNIVPSEMGDASGVYGAALLPDMDPTN